MIFENASSIGLRSGEYGGKYSTLTPEQTISVTRITHLSKILTKAISIHGDANQPPIKGRQSVTYKTLEDWVRATLADNAQPDPLSATASNITLARNEKVIFDIRTPLRSAVPHSPCLPLSPS